MGVAPPAVDGAERFRSAGNRRRHPVESQTMYHRRRARSGTRRLLVVLLALAATVGASPAQAQRCGRPFSRGADATVADSLYVLRGTVGQDVCPGCECDVNSDGRVGASDALRVLRSAVHLTASLSCLSCPRYNFVVFLSDDQRADTLWSMPLLRQRIAEQGVRFEQAFSTTAECAPFRASLHAGGYEPRNTGVKNGTSLNGAMSHFRDTDSLARRLQQAGYTTGFIGKYMHGYYPGYVPPGWTSFVANEDGGQLLDWFNLNRVTYGTSTAAASTGTIVPTFVEYVTDFHRDEALGFLRDHASEPFFLFVSMYAPHWPITPDPADAQLFSEYEPQNPAFREEDLSDKPPWVQSIARPEYGPCTGVARSVLRTLQSADRLVESVIDATGRAGVGDRTYYFYLSDNGALWGEHRLPCDKGMAYEPVIRVPLVAAGPEVVSADNDDIVAAELDLPATILDLAGLDITGDGRSLVPALRGANGPSRSELLIENYGYLESDRLNGGPLWSGLRVNDATGKWKYVEYSTGETELYDLAADPDEMRNLAADAAYKPVRVALRDRLAPRKGLALLTKTLAPATAGADYRLRLDSWGGTDPLHWSIVQGTLPAGLTLGQSSGVLHGVPAIAGTSTFTVQVTDSSVASQSLKPQQFSRRFVLEIRPPS